VFYPSDRRFKELKSGRKKASMLPEWTLACIGVVLNKLKENTEYPYRFLESSFYCLRCKCR